MTMFLLFAACCVPCAAAQPPASDPSGDEDGVLLLAYFRTPAEALHYAFSRDGLTWTALNDNRPVLLSNVGHKSVRDPYIRKGPDGWFHLVSTNSWKARNLMYTRSRDLIQWEPQRLLPVMESVEACKNVWAPEFVHDEDSGDYILFWSSVTEPEHYQRTWYCRTGDFETVSEPKVLFDAGFTNIDATIIRQENRWHLIYKDERGENRVGTDNKAMRVATADALLGPYQTRTGLVSPHLTEGATVFREGGRWLMLFDHFMDKKWGAAESDDLLEWRPVSQPVIVPDLARHGSVFRIPQQLFRQLRDHYREGEE